MNMCKKHTRHTDVIKGCFSMSDTPSFQVIWWSRGLTKVTNICGTFTLQAHIGGLRIRINNDNTRVFSLQAGESRAFTINQLERIEVSCEPRPGTNEICKISFCLIIHYDVCS